MRVKQGNMAPDFASEDIYGNPVALQDLRGEKVMVAFFRYSGCPFCNLRMHDLITAWPEFEARGLKLVTFWQSSRQDILDEVGQQQAPFPMVADPGKRIYRRYGVENSRLAPWKVLLEPRLAIQALRSPYMGFKSTGERDLIPADFLLNPDLTVARAYYGRHVGDHIPLADIRAFLAR